MAIDSNNPLFNFNIYTTNFCGEAFSPEVISDFNKYTEKYNTQIIELINAEKWEEALIILNKFQTNFNAKVNRATNVKNKAKRISIHEVYDFKKKMDEHVETVKRSIFNKRGMINMIDNWLKESTVTSTGSKNTG